jgi:Spy/CpxP family protein refolding chaperone
MDHSCFEKRTMHARILMAALAEIPVAILAYADTGSSPYAGQQTRAIKALSSEEELRTGAGMGLAKAAELNGYPGPLHVLALAKELQLTIGQIRLVTDIHERMSAAAKPLGGEIIDREQELDRLFAQGGITPERLSAETAAIGALQGRLRSVHLAAHLQTRDVLTPEQLAGYRQLRGYGNETAEPHHHR